MKFIFVFIFIVVSIHISWAESPVATQPPTPSTKIKALEYQIYQFNNAFKYDSSILRLRKFIDLERPSNQERFYAFLFMSYTYKRLFDYKSTLQHLDSALVYGNKTPFKAYFEANISCQKAYVLFDTNQYTEAGIRMQSLAKTNYQYLDEEQKAKVIMQEAYLFYLGKNYPKAHERYKTALIYMYRSSPCDVPMIYTKLIQLYEKMGDQVAMKWAADKSLKAADSCKITKYSLYTYGELYKSYENTGNIKDAYKAFKTFDSLNTVYKQSEHLSALKDQELKYQQEKNQISTKLYQSKLENEQQKNLLLLILLVSLVGMVAYYVLWQRQQQLKKEKDARLKYTQKLLESTEEERKRIANDLHDSISSELLSLKKYPCNDRAQIEDKIDHIINDIRIISRNLRPTLFDKIGLVPNIEQLIERLQEQHNFFINSEIDYHQSLPTNNELQLYRIIQEALTNVIKYANAHAAKISLIETENKIQLQIRDNGIGFDVAKVLDSSQSFGLHNIIERSRIIGGTAKIESSSEGTIIHVDIIKLTP